MDSSFVCYFIQYAQMEVILKKLILNQLTKLFPTLSRHQLTLHLSSGHFQLANVPFPEQFAQLPMVRMRKGTIGLLDIKLSWTQLLRKPIQVTLKDVKLDFELTQINLPDPIQVKEELSKLEENIEQQALQHEEIQQERVGRRSLFQVMIDRLINTLELSIEGVDIQVHHLLGLCSLQLRFPSLQVRNEHQLSRKHVAVSQLEFVLGTETIGEEEPRFINLVLEDLNVYFGRIDPITSLEINFQLLAVFHNDTQLGRISTTVDDIVSRKVKQTLMEHAFKADVKYQPNHPVLVDLHLAGIIVEWRSHTFFKIQLKGQQILKKLKQAENSDSKMLVEEEFEVNNYIRAFVSLQLESVKVYFMNHETCMGILRGQQGRLTLCARKWEVEVECIGRNVEYQDCTNYPFSRQSKVDEPQSGLPFIRTLPNDKENFRIWIHVYDNDCPLSLITDRMYNFVEVDAERVQMDYYQQPFLRFFDFLVEQLVNLVTRDYGPDCKLKKGRDVWKQTFTNPRFTEIKLRVTEGTVRLFPVPNHQLEHFIVTMDELLVSTTPSRSYIRLQPDPEWRNIVTNSSSKLTDTSVLQLDFIWELLIAIKARNLQIHLMSDRLIRTITNPLDVNFQFAKLLFGWEYDQFVKDIDKRHDVTGVFDKLQIQMTRYDYLLLMKILMNNVLFDDENDAWYLYNYTPASKLRPTPIRVQIRVNEASVDIIDYSQGQLSKVLTVEVKECRVLYLRHPNAASQIEFCIEQIFADQWNPYGTDLEIMGILNHNLLSTNINLALAAQTQQFLEYQQFQPPLEALHYQNSHFLQNPRFQVVYIQTNSNQGEKNIQIRADKLEGVINLQWFFHILNFAYMDDAVYIVYAPSASILRPMTVEVILNEAIIILQCPEASNMLVCEGDVLITFQKNINTGIHQNYHKINQPNLDEVLLTYQMNNKDGSQISDSEDSDDEIQHELSRNEQQALKKLRRMIETSQSSTLKAESGKVKIMICNMEHFVEEGFSREIYQTIRKREIFSPLQVQWKSQNYQCQCTRDHKFLNESSLQMDKFLAQLTFNDLQLIYDTVIYLKGSMYQSNLFIYSWSADPFERSQKDSYDSQYLQSFQQNVTEEAQKHFENINQHYQLMSNSKKLFNIQGEVLFVNDLGRSFVPLFIIEVQSYPLMIEQGFMKFLLAGNIQLQINYFNLNCGQPEPVLERCNFDLALLRNHDSFPRVSFQLESQGQLNINIHQQLISLLMNCFQSNKKANTIDEKRKLSIKRALSLNRKQSSKKRTIFEQQLQIQRMPQPSNETITLFQVENQSGYDFNFQASKLDRKSKDTFQVFNTKKTNFMTRLDDNLMSTFTAINHINLDFISLKKEKIIMQNIHLDSFFGRKEPWNKLDSEHVPHKLPLDFLIYTYVSKVSRVLLITSHMILNNRTHFDIRVVMQNQTLNWSCLLTSVDPLPLPIELLGSGAVLQFTFEDPKLLSENAIFSEQITLGLKNRSFAIEMKHGIYFTIVKIEEDPKFSLRQNLIFETPFSIQNCLPIPLCVFFDQELFYALRKWTQPSQTGIKILDDRIILDTQNTLLIPLYSSHQNLSAQFLIAGFELTERINLNHQTTIQFIEKNQGSKLKVLVKQVLDRGTLRIYIYPKACLVNTTQSQLVAYERGKKRVPGPLDQRVLLLDEQTHLLFALRDNFSNELMIKGVGETSVELKTPIIENSQQHLSQLHEFGIYITLVCTVPDLGLYSKIVQVAPRYMIVNRSRNNLEIQQENSYGEPMIICPDERFSLTWTDCRKEKMIVVRISSRTQNKKSLWKWSGGIYVSELRTVHFCCSRKHSTDDLSETKSFFKAVITKNKASFYLSIYDVEESQYAYKKQLSMHKSTQVDSIEKVNYIRLPIVTISLITGRRPVELNLVTLGKVEFAAQTQNSFTDYQFRVQFLQIDQNNTYDPVFQVNLTPQQYKTLALGLDDEEKHQSEHSLNTLDIRFRKTDSLEDQVIILEYFTVQLVPIFVKIDEEYVQLLLEFIRHLQENFSQEQQKDQLFQTYQVQQLLFVMPLKREDLIRQLRDQLGFQGDFYLECQILDIPNPTKTIYIKDLVLFPLVINFSFQKSYNTRSESFFLYRVIANALGAAISNVEDAPIVLSGFRTENVYDTTEGILMQLREHYTFGLVKQFMKLIGSIELIGNPLSFFNRISTGVQDFIEKPFGAIAKGPLELGLGILEGATSLIKNTVAGTFYSVNKVTGSMATQVTMLTMDDQFVQRRRRFMQRKPKQIFEGLYQGIVSIIYGVGDGIIGVVQQPYTHGKRNGVQGILKGSAIGVAGLIIKPIAGVLDAASKTAEGLTNTATHFDEKPNSDRIRLVRPFYGKQRNIKPFSQIDAQILTNLQSNRNGILKDIELVDSFTLNEMTLGEIYLILSYQTIAIMTKNGQIKAEIWPGHCQGFKLQADQNALMKLQIEAKSGNLQIKSLQIRFKAIPYSLQLCEKLAILIPE